MPKLAVDVQNVAFTVGVPGMLLSTKVNILQIHAQLASMILGYAAGTAVGATAQSRQNSED